MSGCFEENKEGRPLVRLLFLGCGFGERQGKKGRGERKPVAIAPSTPSRRAYFLG